MSRAAPGLRLTYSVTYDIVTPESAEDGDVAERGYVLPGGYHVDIPDGLTGEPFIRWCREMGVYYEIPDLDDGETLIDVVVRLLRDEGCTETGSAPSYYGEPEQDYTTGEEETRCVHLCDDFDPEELAEISRRLRERP